MTGSVVIRPALPADLPRLLELAAAAREQYAAYSPVFWRPAPDAVDRQRPYLSGLLRDDAVISLVAVVHRTVVGFAIGTLAPPPPVYDPGGPTCMVDDFTVADPGSWHNVGRELLQAVCTAARQRGAARVVVVGGHQDVAKRSALQDAGLALASEWWVSTLGQ